MTPEEFQNLTTEILGNLGDVGAVSANLDKLRTAYGEQHAAAINAAAQVAELTETNNSLKEANMQLFLKTGVQQEKTEEKTEEENTPLSFDDLFNEKGELK